MDVLVKALVVATSACSIFLQWWNLSGCPISYAFFISNVILFFLCFDILQIEKLNIKLNENNALLNFKFFFYKFHI